jgi:histidyl-tRNA synthetase
MEYLSTLMGKYGEEGDKLIFKILNSGNYFSDFIDDIDIIGSKNKGENYFSTRISEKALRYDLTVPFARYVVQNRGRLTFPFKRYQIQPVWRADRPQKGRYREFFQCDVDVIGSNALLNEVELIQIIDDVFEKLKISVVIKINNRKILSGIAEILGEADKIIDITVGIDKMAKIGIDKVNEELRSKGITEEAINKLQPILNLSGTNVEKLNKLSTILASSQIAQKGIEEISQVFDYLDELKLSTEVELDLTLARGLNYYTGAIFEVKAKDAEIGSICGGGRYDDLTGIFGLKDVSGVGVSFGADRIYDVLNQLKGFPEEAMNTTKLLFVNFGGKEEKYCLSIVKEMREKGISTELYPDAAKMKKQMGYADDRKIPFVALVGENEMNDGNITLKDMLTGNQEKLSHDHVIKMISKY